MTHQWPGGARCVAVFSCDFDGTGNEIGKKLAPAGINAAGGYSARRGVARMLDIFDRHGIPATFFVPGYDAEQHPDVVRSIVLAGHEVAAHGYVHESFDVPEDQEERLLRMSHDILVDVTGTTPLGWRSPGGKKSSITLRVLRELGYIFDSSDKDYDMPYPAVVSGQPSREMVEIPNNTATLDDSPLYVQGARTPDEVLDLWKAEFDALYHDTGYFIVTFHPRAGFGSGIPARARVVDRLISYIQTYPDVHFSNLGSLARWCLDPAHGFMAPEVRLGGGA